MLEEATMSEKDPSLAGMGWMGWDEVNVKIFLKHIDLILTTQEQQGPAPDVLQELRSKDCSPTNKDLSSMKHASTVGGAFRAGAVSTLLPGSYGALVCENVSSDR